MRHALPEGGLVRKLWVGEADAYRNHLLRLDAESRRSRFSGVVSDEFIRRYADSLITLKAVIYGFFADGCLRGVAELRPLGVAGEAEAALSVEKAWQSRGVGAALLERTLLTARNRGFKRVRVVCVPGNERMQRLVRRFDAKLVYDAGGVFAEFHQEQPTQASVLGEVISDGYGLATVALDIQLRFVRLMLPSMAKTCPAE